MTEADTRAAIRSFLAAQSTLTLATLGPDQQPMAASLFFAADEQLRLFWVSAGTSRHSQNLERQPAASVTIYRATWSWTEIAGVQMEGQAAKMLAGEAWQLAWNSYLAKFPFVEKMQAEVSNSNLYVFTPKWLRLTDNSRGMGHKEEIGTHI